MERGQRHQVLVVDDHVDAAEVLCLFLQTLGHDVQVSHDPIAALAIVESPVVLTVALLDIGLPGMDGFALARRVREVRGRTITLIALSAYSTAEDRRQATAAGFDMYFVKPTPFEEIEETLRRMGR